MSAIAVNRPVLKISTKAAKLNIRQSRPQFTVRHQRPKMEIRKRAAKFKINRSYSGAKSYKAPAVQISRRFTRVSPHSSNFTERLMSDSIGGNGVSLENIRAQAAESTAMEMIVAENEKSTANLETVSLEWDRGQFEIGWSKNIMEIDWDVASSPEIYVEPHDIKIYVLNAVRKKVELSTIAPTRARVDKRI